MTKREALEKLKQVADQLEGCTAIADRLGADKLGDELVEIANEIRQAVIVLKPKEN